MTAVLATPPFRRPVPGPGFVLAADIPAAWLLTHLGSSYSSRVMPRVGSDGAIVPGCWPLQIADIVRTAERQGQKSRQAGDSFLARLSYFLIRIDDETAARVWADVLSLARTHSVSVFDAAHLELALRLRLPLATTDDTLTRAAAAIGVPIFAP